MSSVVRCLHGLRDRSYSAVPWSVSSVETRESSDVAANLPVSKNGSSGRLLVLSSTVLGVLCWSEVLQCLPKL